MMPAYQRTYNLLVVDDHQLMIDGLSGILKEEKLIAAIYTAGKRAGCHRPGESA
jgi:DNA-binding NarL/FixJ family response regulator